MTFTFNVNGYVSVVADDWKDARQMNYNSSVDHVSPTFVESKQ